MKKKLLLLLVILFSLSAHQGSAQYASSLAPDHVWLGRAFGWVMHDFTIKIEGDSIIGGVTYKKLYNRPHDTQNFYLQSLLREDLNEGKVYRWEQDEEQLFYDYSLEVGESAVVHTIGMELEITISSIETIMVDNTPRRKLNFDDSGRPAFWIEGIGSCYGIADPALGFVADYDPTLHCFYGHNDLLWTSQADAFVCELTLSIHNEDGSSSLFEVWPNPFTDNLNIRSLGNFNNASITITSLTGSLIKQERITTGVRQLNLSDLESGIYMLSITDSNGTGNTQRIVKL